MGVNDNPMVPPPVPPYWYRKCSYCGYPITDEAAALIEERTVLSGGATLKMVTGRMWESQAHRDAQTFGE